MSLFASVSPFFGRDAITEREAKVKRRWRDSALSHETPSKREGLGEEEANPLSSLSLSLRAGGRKSNDVIMISEPSPILLLLSTPQVFKSIPFLSSVASVLLRPHTEQMVCQIVTALRERERGGESKRGEILNFFAIVKRARFD